MDEALSAVHITTIKLWLHNIKSISPTLASITARMLGVGKMLGGDIAQTADTI